jgi:hypothetical protein
MNHHVKTKPKQTANKTATKTAPPPPQVKANEVTRAIQLREIVTSLGPAYIKASPAPPRRTPPRRAEREGGLARPLLAAPPAGRPRGRARCARLSPP